MYMDGQASQVAQQNLPAKPETQVRPLGRKDPLEKGVATLAAHSGTLAQEIPWAEEPDGLQAMGSTEELN